MKAILLAAGYATRMYPLTQHRPKALLEVKGKPIIEYIFERVCLIQDVDEIIVVTNDKFYKEFLEWSKNFQCGVFIDILNDGTVSNDDRLGSLGDVHYALGKKKVHDDFLVIHSDNLFSFDLVAMYQNFKLNRAPIISLYDVGSLEIARRMGNPRIDGGGKIIYFKEKDPFVRSSLCTVGIYFLTQDVIGLLKKYLDEGNSPDRSGDFIAWLYKQRDIYGHVFDGERDRWFDIGSLESYEEAERVW